MASVEEKAYAKVNLALDIVRLREDGYHEMKMINHCINLADALFIEEVKREGKFIVTGNPLPKDNTILQALSLIRSTFQVYRNVDIYIKKRIPEKAGLGGGSSDGAAVLRGLNRLWQLGLSDESLRSLGMQIGADVPYCINRSTALVQGIGEEITLLPNLPHCYVVVVKPKIDIETKWAFREWDRMNIEEHPQIDCLAHCIREGQTLQNMSQYIGNAFEKIVLFRYPEIEHIKKQLLDQGAVIATMSGSGPTVIGYFTNQMIALKTANSFCNDNSFVFVTETWEEM